MKDMQKRLEKLRDDAAECAVISGLARDKAKRELFQRLHDHLGALASEVERAIAEQAWTTRTPDPPSPTTSYDERPGLAARTAPDIGTSVPATPSL